MLLLLLPPLLRHQLQPFLQRIVAVADTPAKQMGLKEDHRSAVIRDYGASNIRANSITTACPQPTMSWTLLSMP